MYQVNSTLPYENEPVSDLYSILYTLNNFALQKVNNYSNRKFGIILQLLFCEFLLPNHHATFKTFNFPYPEYAIFAIYKQ